MTFEVPLLSSSGIGTGGFSWALNYLSGYTGTGSRDGTVGINFNYPQNAMLVASGANVILQLGQNTEETFVSLGGGAYSSADNNTAAVLSRTGEGTSADQFTLVASTGVVSHFFGFYSSITTPGRLKDFTDRYGNVQTLTWALVTGMPRLHTITDSYGRTITFAYNACASIVTLGQITDFWGRQVNLQYDTLGHLVAVVGPSITRGANDDANVFPSGTAFVFQYDVNNPRSERRDDLIAIWHPNQVAPYLDATRSVDVAKVYASATARQKFSYYNDPTDTFQYGKVQQLIESASGNGSVGSGTYGYLYVDSGLPENLINPSDPIVSRTVETDRMGNQVAYDFNAHQMVVHKEVFASRSKNSLEAASWVTWTKYNTHNQPLLIVMPEGNSIAYEYEDETNTIQFGGVPYGRRIGLTKSVTQFPGNTLGIPSRSGSNGQTQLTQRSFNDPIFSQVCASIETRGNPINASDAYFTPQNGGTTPTDSDRSRYATIIYYDYQKDSKATVQADTALQAQLGLTSTQIGLLIDFVSAQMSATDGTGGIPAGFEMALGDVNGEGTGNGTSVNAQHSGNVVEMKYPAVRQLIPHTGGGDPWQWITQTRIALLTSNNRGQPTTGTDPEGNLTVYVRYPENDPEGAGQFLVPTLSNQQYGFVKEIHVDVDPATVMTLVGSEGDLIAFTGNLITRTNTPGVYQDLVTSYQSSGTGGAGCTSCAYDPLGNPLSVTDPRGNTTTFDRNELGEAYRTTSPAPYLYQVETSYDANRNTIQVDTQDQQIQYSSNDPADPTYAQFVANGSGTTANVPMQPGPGGSVRPGWFSNLFGYDLLDNSIEQDIDATGSVPSSLVTTTAYDFNQNTIKITKPMGNLVDYDYDERDLRIATRIGYDPANSNPGAVTVMSYDGNGNLIDVVGPAERGSPSQSLSVIIEDAFGSSVAQTFTGDWVIENTYDGFDRLIQTTDAVGGATSNTFDPGGRIVATQATGSAGGSTPTDRTGSSDVPLSSSETYFDEAGRAYDVQQDVFLNTTSGNTVPSGRTIAHTGGGMATNSTTNSHTGTVTLTTGGTSYVLTRQVFDRAGRVYITASDNTAQTTYAYDGANRQILMTDPLGNQTQNTFDANGNVVGTTRVELCTIEGVTTTESFAFATFFDCLNRATVTAMQGPDGTFVPSLALGTCASWATLGISCPPWVTPTGTIFAFTGYDSRGNRTVTIDPKANTTMRQYDGARRLLRKLRVLRTNGSGSNAVFDMVTTTSNYDGNSRLIRLIDDNGGTTTWTYDTLDRQAIMTFHDGSTRINAYDLASDLIGYTDENGSVFVNAFDILGRKIAVSITPAASVVGTTSQSLEFDGLSRMTSTTDDVSGTDAEADFVFDSRGRAVEEGQTYGGDTRYTTKDAWTSYTPTDLTFPNNRQVTSGYDLLYRRNTVNETSGGASIAAWQFFGSRTATLLLGSGITCSFMNKAGTNSAVQSSVPLPAWGDNTTDRLGYDGSGRLIAKQFLPSGSTTSLVGFTTEYDPASNKLFERALHAESRSALYPQYDSMNRLGQYQRGVLASGGGSVTTPITVPGTNSQRAYNLDGLGNWKNTVYTPEGGPLATEIRQHNKLNEITQFATTPVLYDHGNNAGSSNPLVAKRGNGNITDDGTRTYGYDALNRLTTVTRKSDSAQVAAYAYDAIGRRIQKEVTNGGITGTVGDATYTYLYDGQQIVEELTTDGSTLRQFVWGQYIDELTQLKTYANTGTQPLPAGTYYPLQDLLYRTAATTDASANVVEAYDYDAYGITLMYSEPGTDGIWFTDDDVTTNQPACETLFTGRQYDPETQIYFYRARYYHPQLGRFVSKDPIKYRGGVDLYEYTNGRPTTRMDSSGLCVVGSIRNVKCNIKVLNQITSPAIDDAEDKIIQTAGSTENFFKLIEVLQFLNTTGAAYLADEWGDAATELAKRGVSPGNIEKLAEVFNDLQSKIGDASGWHLYIKVTYEKCLREPSLFQCWLHNGPENVPISSYNTTDWISIDGGINGWSEAGEYPTKIDAYIASKAKCDAEEAKVG